ncbi:MAG: TlpA family protein disulfide reductase [Verrucomicrobia bacterium]|nr:TlpA family protein disulfide reductase [Verrucomicrobiota bacterium]
MKRRRLILSVLLAGLMAAPACRRPAGPEGAAADAPALPVIAKAPLWRLKDIDGREVSSTDFKGKVVVVDFWATWCPPCREEIPGYVALQKKYADQGLVVIGIAMDEGGAAAVKPFAASREINYPMLLADDPVVAAFGGIEVLPTTFLIDRDGNIRDRKVGAVPAAEYEKLVVGLLH